MRILGYVFLGSIASFGLSNAFDEQLTDAIVCFFGHAFTNFSVDCMSLNVVIFWCIQCHLVIDNDFLVIRDRLQLFLEL
ncbi:hypothetical protein HanPI659440_Chr00c03g0709451 [Helianthus annuus]|nr:hypothetical protein HanPI659440_Chr00c03g0709451 [Helianthus annuus]